MVIMVMLLGYQLIQVGRSDHQSVSPGLVRREETKAGVIAIIPVRVASRGKDTRRQSSTFLQKRTAVLPKCCQSPEKNTSLS